MERARALLRQQPGLPVGRVAALCGFASASYFIRAFGACEGCTPGEFRRRP
jgi:AraC-like DNA-binding protein